MTEQNIPVTMVNHVALDMLASPDSVWEAILDDYVEARSFRDICTMEPLDDLSALFGGYRMRFEQACSVDERIIRITERDDAARRLSIAADYLSVPGGLRVYATYHVQEIAAVTRYSVDCHSAFEIPMPAGGKKADVVALLARYTSDADAHLLDYLGRIKVQVEASTSR